MKKTHRGRHVRFACAVLVVVGVGVATSSASALRQTGISHVSAQRATQAVALKPKTAKPRVGGTLTVGILADVTGLDPAKTPNQPSQWVDQLVYSYLVTTDSNLNIVPDVATSWKHPSATRWISPVERPAARAIGTCSDQRLSLLSSQLVRRIRISRCRSASVDPFI